jgi:hypothetical protein
MRFHVARKEDVKNANRILETNLAESGYSEDLEGDGGITLRYTI